MKAIIQDTYGAPEGVLELLEIDKPGVGDREVLVRVHAPVVGGSDWHLMRGLPYLARLVTGLRKPRSRVPGLELAGRVEEAGNGGSSRSTRATRCSAGAVGRSPSMHQCPSNSLR